MAFGTGRNASKSGSVAGSHSFQIKKGEHAMKKHTVYRIEHLPTNFNPLALAVWRYFNGSHDLLEVDGKLVFTDTDIDEINSDEFDPDTLSEIDDWNTFDSLRDFETWCLKVFAEHFGMRIREEELGDFDRICEHITVTPAR